MELEKGMSSFQKLWVFHDETHYIRFHNVVNVDGKGWDVNRTPVTVSITMLVVAIITTTEGRYTVIATPHFSRQEVD